MDSQHHHNRLIHFQSRSPAWLALFIMALMYETLPSQLYWGPHRLMIDLVVILSIPMIFTFWRGHARLNHMISLSVNILITSYMLMSVCHIVLAVLQGHIGPELLLSSAMVLWGANILVFALWYWSLDEGGPHQRDMKGSIKISAFLFPQAQISLAQENVELPESIKNWKPNFFDYLFVAFNTSTAFSPTDTPVLSRWAKLMCMLQALISLTIVVMLAARAINILNPAVS